MKLAKTHFKEASQEDKFCSCGNIIPKSLAQRGIKKCDVCLPPKRDVLKFNHGKKAYA